MAAGSDGVLGPAAPGRRSAAAAGSGAWASMPSNISSLPKQWVIWYSTSNWAALAASKVCITTTGLPAARAASIDT